MSSLHCSLWIKHCAGAFGHFNSVFGLAKTLYAGYDHLAKIIFGGLGSLWFLPNVLETFVLVFGNVKDVPFMNIL